MTWEPVIHESFTFTQGLFWPNCLGYIPSPVTTSTPDCWFSSSCPPSIISSRSWSTRDLRQRPWYVTSEQWLVNVQDVSLVWLQATRTDGGDGAGGADVSLLLACRVAKGHVKGQTWETKNGFLRVHREPGTEPLLCQSESVEDVKTTF